MANNASEKEELDNFLQRVDEIDSIVKGFNCEENEKQEESFRKADQILQNDEEKSKFDRTVINRTTPTQVPAALPAEQDGFLKALEADAAERTRKRQERGKIATVWKEKGNEEFKAGNYRNAIEYYTEGMTHLKDMVVLYTNRAQAYNRLEEYNNALKDCETAIFLGPKTVKAFIHQGKAYVGLGKYDDAINSYQEILKFDPKQQKIVNEYIASAKQTKAAADAESNAAQVFQSGDEKASSIVQVLEKLGKVDRPLMYYDGGMKILATMIKDDTSRTLFRTHGGFQLLTDNAAITGSFKRVLIDGCADDTIDLVSTCLETLQVVIENNDENNKCMANISGFPDTLLTLLGLAPSSVQNRCVRLLLLLSQNAVGRSAMVAKFDKIRLLVSLMSFVQNSKSGAEDAAKILNNLALEKKFVTNFSDRVSDQVLPAFENLMNNSDKVQATVFPSCLSFMGNMAHDLKIRKGMCSRMEFIDASLKVMTRHSLTLAQPYSRDVLHPLLGLLINVTLETTATLKSLAPDICQRTILLMGCEDDEIKGRAIGLLSRVVPHLQKDAMAEMCDLHLPRLLVEFLKVTSNDVTRRYATKTLTVLTQSIEEARVEVANTDKGLKTLYHLLSSSDDNIIIANIALSIGHCVSVPGVSSDLVGSGIVKTLLAKTDTVNSSIKQNCAITLAALATTDTRHLQEVKKLGGIGILSSCIKHVR